ncbi:MAG: hypothetical protein KGJ84_09280 [Elusimicrobia bacterium]|nr:hypothetical protein [Elusimicrobiota bacterium]
MAPGDGGRRAGLGWLILAAALAVPGFLFYNFYSHLKADREKGVAAKARSRAAEGSVFQTQPASLRVAVVQPSTAAAGGTAALPNGAPAAPAPRQLPGAPPNPAPQPMAAVPAAPVNPTAPAALNAAPGGAGSSAFRNPGGVAVSSAPVLTLSRDPMMSPMDLVREREAELERERNEEAIRRAREEGNRPHRKAVRKEPPIDTRIELQGIIARPDGDNMAIVNGNTVNPGEMISVDGYAAKVKVLRITSSEVTFEYKNKHFKKSVNEE